MSPCMPHQTRFQRSIFLKKLLKWRFIILKLIHSQIYFPLYQLLVIDNIFFCLKLQRRDAAVVLAAHVSGNRNVLNFWLSKSLPELSDVMIVLCQNDLCHEYHCQKYLLSYFKQPAASNELVQWWETAWHRMRVWGCHQVHVHHIDNHIDNHIDHQVKFDIDIVNIDISVLILILYTC